MGLSNFLESLIPCGGFIGTAPCQDFSVMWHKGEGMRGERGGGTSPPTRRRGEDGSQTATDNAVAGAASREEGAIRGGKEERERFIHILKDSERFLSEGILKERMEIDTLGEAGIVKLAKKFFTTVIKMKTKML